MSFKSQRRRKLGIDFNWELPKVYAVDFSTGKIRPEIYVSLAQQFCRSRKCRRKARWIHKFSRYVTKMQDHLVIVNRNK